MGQVLEMSDFCVLRTLSLRTQMPAVGKLMLPRGEAHREENRSPGLVGSPGELSAHSRPGRPSWKWIPRLSLPTLGAGLSHHLQTQESLSVGYVISYSKK